LKFSEASSVFPENNNFITIIRKYTQAIIKNKFFKSRAILINALKIHSCHHLATVKSVVAFFKFFRALLFCND
jgi:hypothetical protein